MHCARAKRLWFAWRWDLGIKWDIDGVGTVNYCLFVCSVLLPCDV